MTDWEDIKDRYICTGLSCGEIAKEFGIQQYTLRYRIQKEGWAKLRERVRNGDTELRIERLTGRLLRKLEKAVDESGEMDSKEIKAMTAALKELRDLQPESKSAGEGERKLEVSFLGEAEEMSR